MQTNLIENILQATGNIMKEIQYILSEIEAHIEPDVDLDYEADTAISEETANADIEAQDKERIGAYNAENTKTSLEEIKAKATEAAHAGFGNEIKDKLNEMNFKRISELPQDKWSDFYAFLEDLMGDNKDA